MNNENDDTKNEVLTEEELLRFISRIIACGNRWSIEAALGELKSILEREGADVSMSATLEELAKASPELADLGKNTRKNVTGQQLGEVLREYRERIRREQEFRC